MDAEDELQRRNAMQDFLEKKCYSFRMPGDSQLYVITKVEPSLENLSVVGKDDRIYHVLEEAVIDEARKYLVNFEPAIAKSVDLYNPAASGGIRRIV